MFTLQPWLHHTVLNLLFITDHYFYNSTVVLAALYFSHLVYFIVFLLLLIVVIDALSGAFLPLFKASIRELTGNGMSVCVCVSAASTAAWLLI